MFPHKNKSSITPPAFAKGDAAGFWRWFKTNEAALARELAGAAAAAADLRDPGKMLAAALTRFHAGLVFEIGLRPEEKMDFVISADGIFDRFPAVIALKKAAPESALFEFTAFRQPREGLTLEMHGAQFSAETARFILARLEQGSGRLDIDLFVDPQGLDEQQATQAAFILLDATIGEYDMETMIGRVNVLHADLASGQKTQPLEDLPGILRRGLQSGALH